VARTLAYVYGTAVKPGVSRNGRLYTADMIRAAVDEAQTRLADGPDITPMTAMTHHDAEDDSEKITGRLDQLTCDESGAARYRLALVDNPAARSILPLIETEGGAPPVLRNVSIRGSWKGEIRRVTHEGRTVTTADGLSLDGLDFTKSPGVDGANIDRVVRVGASPRETAADDRRIVESAPTDATVQLVEAAPSPSRWADPGYLGEKALPLDTMGQARAAWAALREQHGYTDRQRKRVRERVRKALAEHGATITREGWVMTTEPVREMELWPQTAGCYRVCLDNGTVDISVSSYGVDPADLELAARKAMDGAIAALNAVDPDQDGDIDIPDADTGDEETTARRPDDDAMETTSPPAADQATGQTAQEQEPRVSEQTPTAAGTPAAPAAQAAPAPAAAAPVENIEPPAPTAVVTPAVDEPRLSLGQVKDLFASFAGAIGGLGAQVAAPAAAVEAAPAAAAPVAEAAPAPAAVQETEEQRIARLVAEGVKAALPGAVQAHVEANGPTRKGLVESTSGVLTAPGTGAAATSTAAGDFGYPEGWTGPLKPLHEYTPEEWRQHVRPQTAGAVLGAKAAGQ
jgi:hypothetical protein